MVSLGGGISDYKFIQFDIAVWHNVQYLLPHVLLNISCIILVTQKEGDNVWPFTISYRCHCACSRVFIYVQQPTVGGSGVSVCFVIYTQVNVLQVWHRCVLLSYGQQVCHWCATPVSIAGCATGV